MEGETVQTKEVQSKDEAIITESLNAETVGQGQYDIIANSTNADNARSIATHKNLQNTYLLGEMENKLTSVGFTSSDITTGINGSVIEDEDAIDGTLEATSYYNGGWLWFS